MPGLIVVVRAVYTMTQATTTAATRLPPSIRRTAVFRTLFSRARDLFDHRLPTGEPIWRNDPWQLVGPVSHDGDLERMLVVIKDPPKEEGSSKHWPSITAKRVKHFWEQPVRRPP